MHEQFHGVFPALLTPFTADDRINFEALQQLIDLLLSQGVNGFYADGSTAEAFLLTTEERKALLSCVADHAGGRCTLIAQIGCVATKQAVELAKHAQSCGYHAVSSVAPFYYKFTFEEIKRYYFAIADAADLPVLIYHIPVLSGVNLSVEQMGELLADPRFIGVKYTSSDYFTMRRFKTAFPDKVMLNGFDETFLAGLSMGADGAIGSTYNFMADKFLKIYRLFREQKIEEAAALQAEADKIIAILCKYGVMQGEKAILTRMGIPMGHARAPFIDLTPAQKDELFRTVFGKS